MLTMLPDGELEPRVRRTIEEHLHGCARCRAEAEALIGTSQLLAASPCPTAAARLPSGAQFVASLPRHDTRRPVFPRALLHGLAAGSLATLVIAAAFLGHGSPPETAGTSTRSVQQPPALVVIDDASTGRSVLLAPPGTSQ